MSVTEVPKAPDGGFHLENADGRTGEYMFPVQDYTMLAAVTRDGLHTYWKKSGGTSL